MPARYALYVAPLAGSRLAQFGNRWLGRDPEGGALLDQPSLEGVDGDRLRAITEAPRHYGFHGTLKPPFRLADGRDAAMLRRAMAAFAAKRKPFAINGLHLQEIGNFLALTPSAPAPALDALAEACVMEFDPYRAPPDAAEIAKRKGVRLTARQEVLLARWGYPYVLEEFRFHLSLTGPMNDAAERVGMMAALSPLIMPLLTEPMTVAELCLFAQPDTATAFRLTDRFPFAS